jgi:FtsP/CotA-like multicopper oxidase with cupredoxin domain
LRFYFRDPSRKRFCWIIDTSLVWRSLPSVQSRALPSLLTFDDECEAERIATRLAYAYRDEHFVIKRMEFVLLRFLMLTRRSFTQLLGSAVISPYLPRTAQNLLMPDYKIEIGTVEWELAPKHRIRTTAYNGQIPGPLLRFTEGRPVAVEITNKSPHPEVVHWHGLFLPPEIDGAMEEGTPSIASGATLRISFTPQPEGFRWYHTHTMAMNDLTRAQYGGQHGFLMIEPRENPARYDREFFLGLHDWGGHLIPSDDGNMNPTYDVATINGKTMGSGEPLQVKQSETVLMHILNSSPSEVHWIALAGHTFTVVSLDGNNVPVPAKVPMLRLAPAERVCATVEMNNPGVWVLGEVRKHVQASGMAIVVEYAGQNGAPKWEQPEDLQWSFSAFSAQVTDAPSNAEEVINIPLVLESKFRGHGSMEAWTINGKMYPESSVEPLKQGRRYRLQFINRSVDDHPMHLHRHSFELRALDLPLKPGKNQPTQPLRVHGIRKDVILVTGGTQAEVEFTANNPGDTLLHCHQQNHMDLGFMTLLRYA